MKIKIYYLTIIFLISTILSFLIFTACSVKKDSESNQFQSSEFIEGIFKLVEKKKSNTDLNCIACEFQPYLIFRESGVMIAGIGGAIEYKIKDNLVIFPDQGKGNYMMFKNEDTIIGIPPFGCCTWVKITKDQFDKETNSEKNQ